MTCNNAKSETPPQPQVFVAPDNALWQKVTPETSAQVSGGGPSWSPFPQVMAGAGGGSVKRYM